ncbi:hypothetical protein [Chlorogloea sp. CCALA 695]|uniref:hypothetical protein n=1 Tax=Chlorogloea sp. CCALA 695 TaxID=2107693 RepID=UPI000D06FA65|nr:hypothetical protein [Chlorogloea sp. CCALA 695]PSB32858.1 hypothetical protein C7B70_08835 [Chlorogloea sp. CCALA 695]
MGSQRENYFFLGFQGKCSPPNYQDVRNSDLSGKSFILIPDNNVCIHISESDALKQDNLKKAKVNNFLNYYHTSNITVLPAYGLIERASQPGTLKLNKDKLIHTEDIFWKKLGHYFHNDLISSGISTIEPLKVFIYPLYAYLLMIKLILVKREPSRTNVRSNLQDLYEFTNEIGIKLALPWQFALAIFGGNTELNKFIHPKKGDVFKALWGAAWDLFYIQLIHEHNGIREKVKGSFPRFILVTDDKACFTIGDLAKVTAAFDYGDTIYDGVMMNYDFPHLRADSIFLSEISSRMDLDLHQKANERALMSELERQNDIDKIINRAYAFILEITKKIQLHEKKGFG